MKKRMLLLLTLLMLCMALVFSAAAEEAVSTTLVMRVSHMTQNAVVDAGEDFSMDVSVNGVTPASYGWYFKDEPIAGADQQTYNIVNASVEDSGVYRMDAFDENGALLVSMEISVRVIDADVPKSGDDSLSPAAALGAMGMAGATLIAAMKRRVRA